jgi:parvulin-like peptidyl-prolyl isomerase
LTEAKKRGLDPATTDFFTVDTPPANLPPSPTFNNTAFALTNDDTVSKVIEIPNGVAVLHLVEIQPSSLLPLDQVKDGIAQQLRQAKAQQSAQITAQILSKAIQGAVAHGSDFKASAAGMGQKAETLPVFVPFKASPTDTRLQTIARAVLDLTPGQVSDPIPDPSSNTALIIHLDNRDKADPAGLAEFEGRFRDSQDEQLRNMVYIDWVNWKSKQPGTHRPPDLDSYGGVE